MAQTLKVLTDKPKGNSQNPYKICLGYTNVIPALLLKDEKEYSSGTHQPASLKYVAWQKQETTCLNEVEIENQAWRVSL